MLGLLEECGDLRAEEAGEGVRDGLGGETLLHAAAREADCEALGESGATLDADALGGLTQAEVLLLAATKGHLRAESRHFSAIAESGPARVVFTYDRRDKRLVRIIELW